MSSPKMNETNQADRPATSNLDEANRILSSKDLYELLNIQNDATDDDIKNSFKKIAHLIDPENDDAPEILKAFKALRRAVLLLSNKSEREKYDESLKSSPSTCAIEQLSLLEVSQAQTDEAIIINRILKAKNHYELLEIPTDAANVDIKKAFKILALQVHPDKSNHPKSKDAYIALENATAVLLKQETREKYDEFMRSPAVKYDESNPTEDTYPFNLSRSEVNAILIGSGIVTFAIGVWAFFDWLIDPKEQENDAQNDKHKEEKKN